MGKINSKTIMLIHGAFVGVVCWEDWIPYFESKGYKVIASPWPYKEAPVADLKKSQPNKHIAGLHLQDLLDHYSKIAREEEKPIAIGHSFGGLLTQLLLNRDLVSAGVALHSVPPQGVIPTSFAFYKSTRGPLGFFTNPHKSFLFNLKQWQYAFSNGQSLQEQKASYEKLVVPESKYVAREALSKTARVDWKKPHNPLLMIAGTADQIMPAAVNRMNFKKYKKNGSIAEFKEYEGINHSVLNLPTWRKQADYIADWLERI